MGEELEKIEKELNELETRKAELYNQKQLLFMRLKSAIALLGQYVEFAEKQDIDLSSLGKSEPAPAGTRVEGKGIIPEIKQTVMEIRQILGLFKLPSQYEGNPSLPEIDEKIKRVVERIEWKTKDKEFIIERREK